MLQCHPCHLTAQLLDNQVLLCMVNRVWGQRSSKDREKKAQLKHKQILTILKKHKLPESHILSTLLKPEENSFFLTEFSSTLNRRMA